LLLTFWHGESLQEKIDQKFKSIELSDSLSFVVLSVESIEGLGLRTSGHDQYVFDGKGVYRQILTLGMCINYPELILIDVCEKGSLVEKNKFSDTLKITTESNTYLFKNYQKTEINY